MNDKNGIPKNDKNGIPKKRMGWPTKESASAIKTIRNDFFHMHNTFKAGHRMQDQITPSNRRLFFGRFAARKSI